MPHNDERFRLASRRTVSPIDPRAGDREGKLKRVLDYAARTVVGLWGLNGVARRVAISEVGLLSAWRGPKGGAKAILRVGWQGEVAPPSRE